MKKFIGTGVAIVTPFKSDLSVDFRSLTHLVNFLIQGTIDYLVVLGTTGESVTLTKKEKKAVIDCVVEATDKRVPLVVGLGGNNTQEIVNSLKKCKCNEIDGILSVAPYYNKPGQKGLYQHYKAIASQSPLPVILYNVPGRTGTNISADTTLKLATDFKNIVGIKEASGDLDQIGKIIKDKPKNFLVISGDDAATLPILSLGGNGVISVLANGYPKDWSDMVRFALEEDFKRARKIHFRFTDMEPSGELPQDAEFSAWYASTLLCLTGESFEMKDGRLEPIKPRKDFDPESKTLGALVMAFRIEHFTGDETWITKTAFVSVRESDAYSLAMNWIMTPALRLIMDYTFTNLSDPIRVRVNPKDGSIDYIEEEHVITARFYLSF